MPTMLRSPASSSGLSALVREHLRVSSEGWSGWVAACQTALREGSTNSQVLSTTCEAAGPAHKLASPAWYPAFGAQPFKSRAWQPHRVLTCILLITNEFEHKINSRAVI